MHNVCVHLWVTTANKAISPMIDGLQSAGVIYVLFLTWLTAVGYTSQAARFKILFFYYSLLNFLHHLL